MRYVLEGSVRRGGNRVRITTQLIDAATGNHMWAERYDRDLVDVFAVQDEITAALSCWRRGWADSPNVPRKSRASSKCARTGNCPALAFSKRNLTSARSRTRRRRSGWSKRWFDAARLLQRSRKKPPR